MNLLSKETYINRSDIWMQLPIFYYPWYLDFAAPHWEIIAIEIGANDYLIWPYHIDKKIIFKFIRTPFLTPYYGPITIGKVPDTAFDKALSLLPKTDMLQVQPHYHQQQNQWFLDNGFTPTEKCTFILDIENKSEEALFQSFRKDARERILQSKQTLTFIDTEPFPILDYATWMEKIYEKRGQTFNIDPQFIKDYAYFGSLNDGGQCINVMYEGKIVGCSFCLFDVNSYYLILTAQDPNFKNSALTTGLIWQHILKAKSLGCKTFDFEGSKIPGVAEFYKKFGGNQHLFNAYIKEEGTLWKTIKKFK